MRSVFCGSFSKHKGVRIKMITGDDTAIAIETARRLGLGTHIIPASDVFPPDLDRNNERVV